MPSCVLLIAFLSTNFIILTSDAALILKQTNVVFRHGQRAPMSENFTAQYPHVWPNGPGQLTQEGKEMMFELGLFFRQRYGNFINSSYNYKEVFMKSSHIDRTIMSGELVLAGLYTPVQPADVWRPNMPWQPIPVHTLDGSTDNIIADASLCSRAKPHAVAWKENEAELEKNARIKPYLNILKNHSEYTLPEWIDGFWCLNSINASLPDWVSEDLFNVTIHEIKTPFMRHAFGSVAQQRVRGGPLVKEIIENMKTCAEDKECNTYKLHGYSGHDTTIGPLMMSLGVFNDMWPPFAAAIMVELYADDAGQHVIQVWYRNSSTDSPYRLNVPGCESNCTLSRFIKVTEKVIADDWQTECNLVTVFGYTIKWITFVILSSVALASIFLILVLSVVLCCRRRRRRKNRFRKMPRSAGESITLMSSINDSDEDI